MIIFRNTAVELINSLCVLFDFARLQTVMLRAIFYCLELVSQLERDAPGLGVDIRYIES
jgi:hypothetical protein